LAQGNRPRRRLEVSFRHPELSNIEPSLWALPGISMSEALALTLFALAVWYVFDALRAREAAVRFAREACKQHGLQLLDDTVQGVRLRLGRDAEGLTRFRRTFLFEFSEDGFTRRSGSLVMLGGVVESMQLEPYRLS
jgi:hypothetical protein